MITERKRRFAEAYARLGNAKRAAIEAGYSEKGAHVRGSELLRDRNVQELIEARRIRRDVHADVTYQNLIAIAQVAMEEASAARKAVSAGVPDSEERLGRAIENARRCLETVGKAEALFVQRFEHTGADGQPLPAQTTNIQVNVDARSVDLSALSDAELASYRELNAKLLAARGCDSGMRLGHASSAGDPVEQVHTASADPEASGVPGA